MLKAFFSVTQNYTIIRAPKKHASNDCLPLSGEDLIHLRAANRNARTLWLRQLEEAVSNALIALAEIARVSNNIEISGAAAGRWSEKFGSSSLLEITEIEETHSSP